VVNDECKCTDAPERPTVDRQREKKGDFLIKSVFEKKVMKF